MNLDLTQDSALSTQDSGLSYSSRLRSPNMLVQLRQQPRGDAVGEHPFGERLQVQLSPHRRKEHRPALEVLLRHDAPGEIVVGATSDDELDLIARPQLVEVLPAVLGRLAGAGALHVEDDLRARIDRRDIDRSGRLDQYLTIIIT